MHLRFAPEGGWKDESYPWTSTEIYVRGKGETDVDKIGKDPTVQALGLGGQIYGTRSDLIFMDDVITLKNARDIERQMLFLDREVESDSRPIRWAVASSPSWVRGCLPRIFTAS